MNHQSDPQREPKAVSGPLAPIHFCKALLNTPSLYLYPSIFHFIPFSLCLPLHPDLPLWLPLSLYSSITLSCIHLCFDLCPYSCPRIHDGVYKALNLRDYLHRFPFPSPTLFSSLHAFFTLYSCFLNLSAICTLSLLLPTSHFLSLHLSISPVVDLSVKDPSVLGRIGGLIEKTQSVLFSHSDVIYALMWRVFLLLKWLDRRLPKGKNHSWLWSEDGTDHSIQRHWFKQLLIVFNCKSAVLKPRECPFKNMMLVSL